MWKRRGALLGGERKEAGKLVVAHGAASVTLMKDPAEGLGEVIWWVEDTRDEVHDNISSIFPVLNGKMLDVNVAGTLGGHLGVDHVDGGFVVHPDGGSLTLCETKFFQDGP